MDAIASENVQHGFTNSWIDYDRAWFFREYLLRTSHWKWRTNEYFLGRQILVSEYTASILGNLVAIALTLAGPRLWILFKALAAGANYHCRDIITRFLRHYRHNPSERSILMNHNVITTEESHSELGAAHELLENVWKQLGADRIELPLGSTTGAASVTRNQGWRNSVSGNLTKLWTNFLRHPMDIAISIILSVILIGLFVAETSGNILSARIVSDAIAQIHSSNCSIVPPWEVKYDPPNYQASRYAQKCYDAPLGSDGCNDFYNQSIGFIERSNDACPFSGNVCAQGRYSALTFDTGYVHAKTIGLNVAQMFYLRRSTTCAPLVPDDQNIRVYNHGSMIAHNLYNCSRFEVARSIRGSGQIFAFV